MAEPYDIIWRGEDATIKASNLELDAAVNATGAVTMAGLTNTAGVTLGGQVELGSMGTISNAQPIAYYNFGDGTAFLPLAPVDNQFQFVKNINGTGTLILSGAIDGATEITMVTQDAWLGIYDSSGTTWRTINTYTA